MSSIFIDEVEICKDGPALGIMYVCSTFLIKTQCMQNGVAVVLKGRGGGGGDSAVRIKTRGIVSQ